MKKELNQELGSFFALFLFSVSFIAYMQISLNAKIVMSFIMFSASLFFFCSSIKEKNDENLKNLSQDILSFWDNFNQFFFIITSFVIIAELFVPVSIMPYPMKIIFIFISPLVILLLRSKNLRSMLSIF